MLKHIFVHKAEPVPERKARMTELRAKLLADWDPDDIERRVLLTQARRKIARCRNVCADVGW